MSLKKIVSKKGGGDESAPKFKIRNTGGSAEALPPEGRTDVVIRGIVALGTQRSKNAKGEEYIQPRIALVCEAPDHLGTDGLLLQIAKTDGESLRPTSNLAIDLVNAFDLDEEGLQGVAKDLGILLRQTLSANVVHQQRERFKNAVLEDIQPASEEKLLVWEPLIFTDPTAKDLSPLEDAPPLVRNMVKKCEERKLPR